MATDTTTLHQEIKQFPAFSQADAEALNRGAFPNGFLWWLRQRNWWGEKRCFLCSGAVRDPDAIRVDVDAEVEPTHREDGRRTSLPDDSFDLVVVDPPSSPQRAKKQYGDESLFGSINEFAKEAARIVKPGGLVVLLSHDVPRRIKGCEFVAICGVYTMPLMSRMRCCAVARKVMSRDPA